MKADGIMQDAVRGIYYADTQAQAHAALSSALSTAFQTCSDFEAATAAANELLPFLAEALSSPFHSVGSVPGGFLREASEEYLWPVGEAKNAADPERLF